jgi:hypothetical protein
LVGAHQPQEGFGKSDEQKRREQANAEVPLRRRPPRRPKPKSCARRCKPKASRARAASVVCRPTTDPRDLIPFRVALLSRQSVSTTKLYDRTKNEVRLSETERIQP